MTKTIFCLSFIFAVTFAGLAVCEVPEKDPEKVEESSGSMILVPPLFYYDDGSFYTLLFGWRKDRFCYVVPPLYVGLDSKRSFDSYFIFPLFNLRKVHQPEQDVPSYQGHAFMLYGFYKDDLATRRWILWPFCNYSEQYHLEDMRNDEERKEKSSSPRLERKLDDRSFLLFPFYTDSRSLRYEYIKDKNDPKKSTKKSYYINVNTYFMFVAATDVPEKMSSSFSIIGPFFNIENDDHGLKRLDILFIPFFRKKEAVSCQEPATCASPAPDSSTASPQAKNLP